MDELGQNNIKRVISENVIGVDKKDESREAACQRQPRSHSLALGWREYGGKAEKAKIEDIGR